MSVLLISLELFLSSEFRANYSNIIPVTTSTPYYWVGPASPEFAHFGLWFGRKRPTSENLAVRGWKFRRRKVNNNGRGAGSGLWERPRSIGVITPTITIAFSRFLQISTPLLPKQVKRLVETY